MIYATTDDRALLLEDGRLTIDPPDEKLSALFASRKLRTRATVEIDNGGVAEELREAVSPGDRMRALVITVRATIVVDDGDT